MSTSQTSQTDSAGLDERLRRLEAENARLRAESARLRRLIEHAPDLTIIMTMDGRITYASPGAQAFMGQDAGQVPELSAFSLVHPDDLGHAAELLAGATDHEGTSRPGRFRARRGDGEWRLVEATPNALLNDPAIQGVILHFRDVTDSAAIERDLHDLNSHFSRAQTVGGTASFDWYPESRLIRWSPAMYPLLGTVPNEQFTWNRLVEATPDLFAFFVPEDRERAYRMLDHLDDDPHLGEYRIARSDGAVRIVEALVERSEEAGPAHYIGTLRDVTEIRRADEALRESEERYRTTVDNAGVMTYSATADGTILAVNRVTEETLGYDPSEFPGAPLAKFISSRSLPAAAEMTRRLLQDGEPRVTGELTLLLRDGTEIATEVIATTLHRAGNTPLVQGFVRDVTDERAVEALRQEAERRNRLLFSQSQVGIVRRRISDRAILEVNDRMAQMRGFPTAEAYLAATDYHAGIHMDQDDLAALDRSISAGETVDGQEFAIGRADGGTTWLRAYLVPYLDEDYYEMVAVDVTAERKARSRLEESERRNRSLFENALVGIIRMRLSDGQIIELNDRMAQMRGYEDSRARARNIAEIGEDEQPTSSYLDADQRQALARHLRTHGVVENAEFPIKRRDGSTAWVRVFMKAYPEFDYIEGIAVDVTAEREARKQREESEARYREIVESANDIIYTTRWDGWLTSVNRRAEELLGYTHEEMLSMRLGAFVAPESESAFDEAMLSLDSGADSIKAEGLLLRKDGTRLPMELAARLIRQDGQPVRLLGIIRDLTDRIEADRALRESEERYREIVESANDIIYTTEFKGVLTSVNRRAEELLGYTHEELLRMPIVDLVAEESLSDYEAQTRALRNGVNPVSARMWLRRKDGSLLPTEVTPQLVFRDGKPVRVLGTVRDLTDRMDAERALRESEERYREIVESANDIIYTCDFEGRMTSVNPQAEKLFGYTREELLQMRISESLAPESLAITRDATLRLLAGEKVEPVRVVMIRKDGSRVHVEVNPQLISRDGQPYAVLGIVRDITDRIEAEAAIEQTQRHLQQVIDNIPAFVGVISADGIFKESNQAPLIAAGLQPEDVYGKPFAETYWWAYSNETMATIREAVSRAGRGESVRQDIRVRIAEDQYLLMDIAFAPLRGEGGQVIEIVASAVDITMRAELEKQLRQSQKLEAVGQLAGGIAHDFNNLLTVINGYSEMAMGSLEPANPIFADLKEIRDAGDRAAGLTRQLLAFSRQQVLKTAVLDINEIVTNLGKMLHRLIGEDIRLVLNLSVNAPQVEADIGQIEQVIMNLAINARDAMPEGGLLEVVTTRETREGRTGILLRVVDTGEGMDEITRTRIFEPFFTTKEQGRGTGLGLATVYGIVTQLGGTIDVTSAPGQGTAFNLWLPPTTAPQVAVSEQDGAAPRGREIVVLVEDEGPVRRLLASVLRRHGYHVLEAANGEAALATVEAFEGPIDLLLTDYVMPGMNGRDLADRLLALHPGVAVLFMSGYIDDSRLRDEIRSGASTYMQKPLGSGELLRRIREALGERPTA